MNREKFDKEVSPDGFLAIGGQTRFPVYENQIKICGAHTFEFPDGSGSAEISEMWGGFPSRSVRYKEIDGSIVEVAL